jgi:hypothetical protein
VGNIGHTPSRGGANRGDAAPNRADGLGDPTGHNEFMQELGLVVPVRLGVQRVRQVLAVGQCDKLTDGCEG